MKQNSCLFALAEGIKNEVRVDGKIGEGWRCGAQGQRPLLLEMGHTCHTFPCVYHQSPGSSIGLRKAVPLKMEDLGEGPKSLPR